MATQKISTKTERETHSAQVLRELQYHEVTDSLAYFRLTYRIELPDTASASLREQYPENITYGFASIHDILAFADDKVETLQSNTELVAVSDAFLAFAAKEGLRKACHIIQIPSRKNAWDEFEKGRMTAANVVQVNLQENLLLSLDNKPMPVALDFSGEKGGISDENYNLDTVMFILLVNSQVSPLSRVHGDIFPVDKWDARWIHECPSGARPRMNEVLFRFTPTQEEMQKIWKRAREVYPNAAFRYLEQAVIDLDLLGLRAGDAAKKASD